MTIPTANNAALPDQNSNDSTGYLKEAMTKPKIGKEKQLSPWKRRFFCLLPFILGAIIGSFLAFLCFYEVKWAPRKTIMKSIEEIPVRRSEKLEILSNDELAVEINSTKNISDLIIVKENEAGANLTVLCVIIMTTGKLQYTDAISDTFSKRCNKTAYYAAEKPKKREPKKQPIPNNDYTVHLIKNAGGVNTWSFHQAMLQHMRLHYNQGHDWIYVCNDRCYVVLENLRSFASNFSPMQPIAAGHVETVSSPLGYVIPSLTRDYLNAQAGYMINNIAFNSLVEAIDYCAGWWYLETVDRTMSRCLNSLNVQLTDARDTIHGGHRFIPQYLSDAIANSPQGPVDQSSWYWLNPFAPRRMNEPCCSDRAVSFGNLNSHNKIHLMEYALYNLDAYGRNQNEDQYYNDYY